MKQGMSLPGARRRIKFKLGLTPKEKKVFEFVRAAIQRNEVAPTFEEIQKAFGLASIHSVQQYIQQLVRKGYLRHPGGNLKRAVTVAASDPPFPPMLREGSENIVRVPFVGTVAAGRPIEAIEQQEEIEVPVSLLRSLNCFALKVQGNSMIEDHICDGDTILVRKQSTAENGQTVVALVNNEATVKVFYRRENGVELLPRNAELKPIYIKEGNCEIQGIVVGIIRKV